jgi:hypothetical protein
MSTENVRKIYFWKNQKVRYLHVKLTAAVVSAVQKDKPDIY